MLSFENVYPEDTIQLIISDTSGATNDLEINKKLVEGKLTVSAAQLQTLSHGTCTIDIYRSSSNPLQQATAEGGRIIINYIIKEAEIELSDHDKEPIATL